MRISSSNITSLKELAGFKVSEMAFLFREALDVKNIYLPIRFINDSIVSEGEG